MDSDNINVISQSDLAIIIRMYTYVCIYLIHCSFASC